MTGWGGGLLLSGDLGLGTASWGMTGGMGGMTGRGGGILVASWDIEGGMGVWRAGEMWSIGN